MKIGDKVVCVNSYTHDLVLGKTYTISGVKPDRITVDGVDGWCWVSRFRKVEPEFDLHTNPWFIKTPTKEIFNLVVEWLYSKGITFSLPSIEYHSGMDYVTNSFYGNVEKWITWGKRDYDLKIQTAHEIKFTFKTTIDAIEYPVILTQDQKEIQKIDAKIAKLMKRKEELTK